MIEIITLNKMFSDEKRSVLSALRSGAVIAYPTDTLYGLGVDAFNVKAVRRLLDLKGHPVGKPLSVLYTDVAAVLGDFSYLNDYQRSAVQRLLPGKITLILPTGTRSLFPKEIAADNTVGVRVIDLEPLNCILRQYPHPITTTSVNPAGQPPACSVAKILSYFGDQISLILAHDKVCDPTPSTLVRVGVNSIEIIRPGAVAATEIEKKLKNI